jgi:hypothetical protein
MVPLHQQAPPAAHLLSNEQGREQQRSSTTTEPYVDMGRWKSGRESRGVSAPASLLTVVVSGRRFRAPAHRCRRPVPHEQRRPEAIAPPPPCLRYRGSVISRCAWMEWWHHHSRAMSAWVETKERSSGEISGEERWGQ